jgi:hypothetical protein
MKRLVLIAVAAGVTYVLVTHLRNKGKNLDVSGNGSLGDGARQAVDDVTDRISV